MHADEPLGAMPTEEALAQALDVLANPVRLAILRQLRTPKILKEIRVQPAGAERSGQIMSRQAVKDHLDRLVNLGVVTPRDGERPFGPALEYLLNHQMLFALSEEFRGFAKMRPTADPGGATQEHDRTLHTPVSGPALVVVKGLDEGHAFALHDPAQPDHWTIGRQAGTDVCLDFDPFVSGVNSLVTLKSDGYWVKDLDESRNGTAINFVPLMPQREHRLRHGDVIGVGRTLLLFRDVRD